MKIFNHTIRLYRNIGAVMSRRLFGHNDEHDIDIPVTEETTRRFRDAVFPTEYCIDSSFITAVKTQYVGNCWVYASTAMMVTFLLKNQMVSGSVDTEKIFSETHMTYAEFDISNSTSKVVNPEGMTPQYDSANNSYSYGGSRVDATSYFSRNKNSVLEVTDPNFLTNSVPQLPERDNSITNKKYNTFEVSGIFFIEDPVVAGSHVFVDNIKYCLMNYGIVYLGFYYLPDNENIITNDPKFGSTMSYYMDRKPTPTDMGGGHAVAIVGWDDTFDNFKKSPAKPGAFKVKNSWGTGGNLGDGFVWISYEDVNLCGCYCITAMKQISPDIPRTIYTKSNFGMEKYLPETLGEIQSVFSDTYTTLDDNEIITAVGVCNLTPCKAGAELSIAGQPAVQLFKDQYLDYPGFHRIDVKEQVLGAKGTNFTITITYDAVGMSATYIPLEYKYSTGYNNLDLSKISGSIKINGRMTKITDYNFANNSKYGNLPIYVSTRGNSQTAKDYTVAYKALSLPALTADGLLSPLPSDIKPAGASAAVPIEWRAEPYGRDTYDISYKSPVVSFKVGSVSGMANKLEQPYELYITAIIGNGIYALKKEFTVTFPSKKKDYDFTVGSVTDGNKVTIEGTLSGIAGATVKVSCNNVSSSVRTDKSGKWIIKDFSLYNPLKDGGWKDTYASSTISVQVADDNNITLMEGNKTVKLERPFTVSDTVVTAIAACGTAALLSGLVFCIENRINRFNIDVAGAAFAMGNLGEEGLPLLPNAENVTVDFGGSSLSGLRSPLFESCGDVQDVSIELDADFSQSNIVSNTVIPDKFAGLALNVKSGSVLKNCSVSGTVTGAKAIGGLFYVGENITAENCKVNLTVSCPGDCGAVAHTISGRSSLKNISSDLEGFGTNVAGIAVSISGTVSQCKVSLNASAKSEAAGVCCCADNVTIANVLSDCSVGGTAVHSGTAAGIASRMTNGSTIKNCVVLGKIDAGTEGMAYGIGKGIPDKSETISHCLCAASFISGAKAFRISDNAGSDCMAYQDMINNVGTGFVSAGETLKVPAEILSIDLFTDHGFDMTNIWQFDSKKGIPYIRGLTASAYRYPFPNPYATQNGKYKFAINTELALYGAANSETEKITWGGLSPADHSKADREPGFQYMIAADEFYLQAHLMITEKGEYTMNVISVIDGHGFANNISLEII